MNLYHTELFWTPTATSADADYPVTNLASRAVLAPWRSTSLLPTTITLAFGQSRTPAAILLQGANFNDCDIETSTDGANFTKRKDLTLYRDPPGPANRYKGFYAFSAVTASHVRVVIPAGTPQDDQSYWSLGAVYLWNDVKAIVGPGWDSLQVNWINPGANVTLPGGQPVIIDVGAQYARINLPFGDLEGEDTAQVIRLAKAGVVGFSLDTGRGWTVWPCRYLNEAVEMALISAQFITYTATMQEQV